LFPSYTTAGESAAGHHADKEREVFQDIPTGFFILLAIFFPSVTGIFTGLNMSGNYADV
jgi:hypothetical protein